jgi:hypothetical protein
LKESCAILVLVVAGMFVEVKGQVDNDKVSPKDVIEKAIAARGGKKNLERLSSFHLLAKGTIIDGTGQLCKASSETWFKDGRIRVDTIAFVDEQQVKNIMVYDGKNLWYKVNDEFLTLNADDLVEARSALYLAAVTRFSPFLGGESKYRFSCIDGETVDRKKTNGIAVKSDGFPDIKLYFHQGSSLLLKGVSERNIGGKQGVCEQFFWTTRTTVG